MTVPENVSPHKQLSAHYVRFEPCAGARRVAIYQSVASLVERFQGSRFAFCPSAPLDLCLAAFLAELGGTVDAAGFQRLLLVLEATR